VSKKRPDGDAEKLEQSVSREVSRFERARRERPGTLAQIAHASALGLGVALPLVSAAYLGHFLDHRASGYSMRWTLSLIFVGLLVGVVNAYFILRE
jgi:ATP synthase protein I